MLHKPNPFCINELLFGAVVASVSLGKYKYAKEHLVKASVFSLAILLIAACVVAQAPAIEKETPQLSQAATVQIEYRVYNSDTSSLPIRIVRSEADDIASVDELAAYGEGYYVETYRDGELLAPREPLLRPSEPMDVPELIIGNAGEDLRINSDVGIGIDDPLAKLHVIGTIRSDGNTGLSYQGITTSGDGANNRAIEAQDYTQWIWNTSSTWGLFWAGSDGAAYSHFGTTNPNEYVFVGGGNARASIDGDNGNMWIGGDSWVGGGNLYIGNDAEWRDGGTNTIYTPDNLNVDGRTYSDGFTNDGTMDQNGTADFNTTVDIHGTLHMNNNNIDEINHMIIVDPGANEGLGWDGTAAGWIIDVSPTDRSNSDGNLNLYGTANNVAIWRPIDMRSNQITNMACDGGTNDAATCGWVNSHDDNTTYSAGNDIDISGTTISVEDDIDETYVRTYYLFDRSGPDWGLASCSGGASVGTSGEDLAFIEPEASNLVWAYIQDDWGLHLTGAPNLHVTGNVGIGTSSPSAKLDVVGVLELSGTDPADPGSDIVRLGDGGTQLQVQTNYGYVNIGPANTSWCHFGTDRPWYYFNPGITVDGNLRPYTSNTRYLGESGYYWNRVYAGIYYDGNSTGYYGDFASTSRMANIYANYISAGTNYSTSYRIYGYSTGQTAGVYGYNNYNSSDRWGVYGYRTHSSGQQNGNAAVYGYLAPTSAANYYGTYYNEAGVKGYCLWGDSYHFGVSGTRYDDSYTRTAGVFGAVSTSTTPARWGTLGYQNSGSSEYGVYGNSWYAYGGGRRRHGSRGYNGEIRADFAFGGYSEFMAGWFRGELYGLHLKGDRYSLYTDGNNYSNGIEGFVQQTESEHRAISYTNTSVDVSVNCSGMGRLESGRAEIHFDPTFSELASSEIPIVVTVSPMGSSKGVFVAEVNNNGFVVVENEGGESDVEFSWIAMARRAGYEKRPEPPVEILATDFDDNWEQVMHNENDLETVALPVHWNGSELTFTARPENQDEIEARQLKEKWENDPMSLTDEEWQKVGISRDDYINMLHAEENQEAPVPPVDNYVPAQAPVSSDAGPDAALPVELPEKHDAAPNAE